MNKIGLDQDNAKKVATGLNTLLADLHIFYQNLRGLHWNIKGKRFFSLHEKFEELYDEVAEDIDEVAERILTLGLTPDHTLESFIKKAKLKVTENVSDGDKAVASVVENLTHLLDLLRTVLATTDEANDEGSNALVSDLIVKYEKNLWMYSSVIE